MNTKKMGKLMNKVNRAYVGLVDLESMLRVVEDAAEHNSKSNLMDVSVTISMIARKLDRNCLILDTAITTYRQAVMKEKKEASQLR